MSYDHSEPLDQILRRLSKMNGALEIKCVKDKKDPKLKIFLIFIRIGILGHRKSLVEQNVKKFEGVNLTEGRINLETSADGRMELVGIIRPKNINRLWIVSLGLLKKMSYCIFEYEGNRNGSGTDKIHRRKDSDGDVDEETTRIFPR